MRIIIQERENVFFNGINISDEVKSQVTDIKFITKDIKFTRNLTFLEKMKVKIFGNYNKTGDILEPTTLKRGKNYSIYIEGMVKQEFCRGALTIECESVFINENGEVFVEAAKNVNDLNVQW